MIRVKWHTLPGTPGIHVDACASRVQAKLSPLILDRAYTCEIRLMLTAAGRKMIFIHPMIWSAAKVKIGAEVGVPAFAFTRIRRNSN